MEYVRKVCPVCGNEFFVLKTAKEKAVYCNLECWVKAQKRSWHQEDCLSATK